MLRDHGQQEDRGHSAVVALSPDARLLAVSNEAVVQVYDVKSRQLLAELVGRMESVWQLHFVLTTPDIPSSTDSDHLHTPVEKYLLFSEASLARGADGRIILWSLDAGGRQSSRTMPFALGNMADRAIGAISADLEEHHGLG